MPELPSTGRRWVLVAGATGRVGRHTARALADGGADLVLLSRRPASDPELERGSGEVLEVSADITSEQELAGVVDKLAGHGIDRLDGVVNCVTGYTGVPTSVAELDPTAFGSLVTTDLIASYLLVRATLPLLAGNDRARIVLLSSLAGQRGRPGAAHLCAAKAGVLGLVKGLAHDLAGDRILVNAVAPGPIRSPDHPALAANSPIPFTEPEQVAATVVQLLAPECRFTGQVLELTGGRP
jgi:NAD(P)-dependent dehydrogenase (short-subunit alcohol dehydrogenase family)